MWFFWYASVWVLKISVWESKAYLKGWVKIDNWNQSYLSQNRLLGHQRLITEETWLLRPISFLREKDVYNESLPSLTQCGVPKIMTAMKSLMKNWRKLSFSPALVDVSGVATAQALQQPAFSSAVGWPQLAAKLPPRHLLAGCPQKVWGRKQKEQDQESSGIKIKTRWSITRAWKWIEFIDN